MLKKKDENLNTLRGGLKVKLNFTLLSIRMLILFD